MLVPGTVHEKGMKHQQHRALRQCRRVFAGFSSEVLVYLAMAASWILGARSRRPRQDSLGYFSCQMWAWASFLRRKTSGNPDRLIIRGFRFP